ncbi:MAG: hypothetical protein LBR80_04925 [Deltaproteobacteria bacterium]|jgi:hypothetical protein|nr:hypothetical protein [Deltaproteobacteria bacterium]
MGAASEYRDPAVSPSSFRAVCRLPRRSSSRSVSRRTDARARLTAILVPLAAAAATLAFRADALTAADGTAAAPLLDPPAVEWSRAYGGPGDDRFLAVAALADGGLLAAGQSASADGDVESNAGAADAWILRLDGSGSIVWKRSIGGSGPDSATAVAASPDGGFVVAGTTFSADGDFPGVPWPGGAIPWAAKLDASGATVWLRSFPGGGPRDSRAVYAHPDGGYALLVEGVPSAATQEADHACGGRSKCRELAVIRLDDGGGTLWERGPVAGPALPGMAAAPGPQGGAVVAYATLTGDGGAESKVTGVTQDGMHLWTRTSAIGPVAMALAPAPGTGGGFMGAGDARRHMPGGDPGIPRPWLFRLGPRGNLEWQLHIAAGFKGALAGAAESEGVFFGAGYVENPVFSGAEIDFLAMAADPAGRLLWTLCLGGSGEDRAVAAAAFPGGRLAVAGLSASTDGDLVEVRGELAGRTDSDGWIVIISSHRP